MADRNMDREDKFLSELFSAEPLADDGFSTKVMRRIRRQVWVDRLALPVAAVIGLAVAINPLLDLLTILPSLARVVPFDLPEIGSVPALDADILILGGLVLVAGLFVSQFAED